MSAIPQPDPTPEARCPASWLDLETAAKLCGQSERHLRRRCGSVWQAEGKARLLQEAGQKSRWQVRSDADPAFAAIENRKAGGAKIENPPVPLADATQIRKPLLDQASGKLAIVREWELRLASGQAAGFTEETVTTRYLQDLAAQRLQALDRGLTPPQVPSRRSLYRWARAFKNDGGLAGLVDGRSRAPDTRAQARAENPFFAYLKSQYLDQRQRSIALCYDRSKDKALEMGWDLVSESHARRFLKALPPAEVILHRQGQTAFRTQVAPHLSGDYSGLASNEVWNADHMQFDVLVCVGTRTDSATGELVPILKRPWLTSWQDLASRKIVGYVIRAEDPDTAAIVAAWEMACRSHGVPLRAYTDNGKDFDSRVFTGLSKAERRARILWRKQKVHVAHDQVILGGLYAGLGVEHLHAWPYNPESKPIERFHGTVHGRFDVEWETYCGRSPEHKPEDLPDQIAAGHAPTLEEFVAVFAEWLERDYHGRLHTGDAMDMTPADAWPAKLLEKRVCPDHQLEILCRPRLGPLRVGRDGLVHAGLRYAGHGELVAHLGQSVWIRTRPQLETVSVWDAQDNPLGVVALTEAVPRNATQEELKAALQEKRADIRAIRDAIPARLRLHETAGDRIRRIRAATTTPTPAEAPAMVAVRPGFAAAANAVQAAEERVLKRAVGDGVTPRDGGFNLASLNADLDWSPDATEPRPFVPTLTELLGEDDEPH